MSHLYAYFDKETCVFIGVLDFCPVELFISWMVMWNWFASSVSQQ
jgi:hypothetical protein